MLDGQADRPDALDQELAARWRLVRLVSSACHCWKRRVARGDLQRPLASLSGRAYGEPHGRPPRHPRGRGDFPRERAADVAEARRGHRLGRRPGARRGVDRHPRRGVRLPPAGAARPRAAQPGAQGPPLPRPRLRRPARPRSRARPGTSTTSSSTSSSAPATWSPCTGRSTRRSTRRSRCWRPRGRPPPRARAAQPATSYDLSYAIVSALTGRLRDYLGELTREVWKLEQRVTAGHIGRPRGLPGGAVRRPAWAARGPHHGRVEPRGVRADGEAARVGATTGGTASTTWWTSSRGSARWPTGRRTTCRA